MEELLTVTEEGGVRYDSAPRRTESGTCAAADSTAAISNFKFYT